MAREYGQFCGVARALELVGGRWSMLIVRELLTGPKRFTDLAHGLGGIPTNMLSARLRELEDDGLVRRALKPGRSTSVVYELTPYGRELEDPIVHLGLWGAKALGAPKNSDTFSTAALQLALQGTFDPDAAAGHDLLVELRLEQRRLHVWVTEGTVSFPTDPPTAPQVVLEVTWQDFTQLFARDLDITDAAASGQARVDGPIKLARRFFEIFHLPSRQPQTS